MLEGSRILLVQEREALIVSENVCEVSLNIFKLALVADVEGGYCEV